MAGFEGHGEYTDSTGRIVNLGPDTFTDPWPDAPGLTLIPSMKAVVDNPDGTRTITLEVSGTTTAMADSQTARVTESRWIPRAAAMRMWSTAPLLFG